MAVNDKLVDNAKGNTRITHGAQDLLNNARGTDLVTSATGTQTPALPPGIYAVWAAADHWVKVSDTNAADVTALTGFLVRANTTAYLVVRDQNKIGAVAGGASTFSYHRVTT